MKNYSYKVFIGAFCLLGMVAFYSIENGESFLKKHAVEDPEIMMDRLHSEIKNHFQGVAYKCLKETNQPCIDALKAKFQKLPEKDRQNQAHDIAQKLLSLQQYFKENPRLSGQQIADYMKNQGWFKGENGAYWECESKGFVKCDINNKTIDQIYEAINLEFSEFFQHDGSCFGDLSHSCVEKFKASIASLSKEEQKKLLLQALNESMEFGAYGRSLKKVVATELVAWIQNKGFLDGNTKVFWQCKSDGIPTCFKN